MIRRLALAYVASLCFLALLAVTGVMIEDWNLYQANLDTREIHLASRQKMLSEKILKLMMAIGLSQSEIIPGARESISQTLEQLLKTHEELWHGDEEDSHSHSHGTVTEEIRQLFSEADLLTRRMTQAVDIFLAANPADNRTLDEQRLAANQELIQKAHQHQMLFVAKMTRIVAVMEKDSEARLDEILYVDTMVLAFIIVILSVLGLFILRPMAWRLSESLESLERERSGLAGFVRYSPSPIIQLNPQGEVTSYNLGAEKLLDLFPSVLSERKEKAEEMLQSCVTQEAYPYDCSDLEVVIDERWYLFRFTYLEKSGQVFALGIDITSRKMVEETMAAAKDIAEDANRLKSQFLTTMSHELRTPLNAIIGFSDALLNGVYGELAPKQRVKLKHVLDSGYRLLNLVDSILSLSEIEAGQVELHPQKIPLVRLLEDGENMIQQTALEKKINVLVEVPPLIRDHIVLADERKLKQVIFNLLTNSVKFTPEGGKITISAELDDPVGEVRIWVSDSGIGFTGEEAKGLFEAFFQADSSLDRKFEGTGLGLALCRKLVELHGGRIWARSEGRNQGSTFTFTVPMVDQGEDHTQ